MIKRILEIIRIRRNGTPLTRQVEERAKTSTEHLNSVRQKADIEPPLSKNVTFTLPPHHCDKNSSTWRSQPRMIKLDTARRKWENAKYRRKRLLQPLTKAEIRLMVLDGSIPSGISDTGATSTAG